jgi:hypothetical protein
MHTTYDAIDFVLSFVPAALVLAFTAAVLWAIITMFPKLDDWMIATFDRLCGMDEKDAEIPPFVTRAFHPLDK